ncbi:dihydropteroate synthase [Tepidamorphus sp. 3E244]|uniref:dihydropteroate synthase n=1 Tax=Tepidamorphus sp. 3E244 TaxID=3385498 RepID=UPI0038FBFA09
MAPARSDRALLMAALNVTPDSFSDGGHFFDPDKAIARAAEMVAQGADILDIGGESTRPGSAEVSAEEELARLIPVFDAVLPSITVPVSIDTYKADTADAALKAGATIVNDVWGFTRDPEIAAVTAHHDAAAIIGHWEPDLSRQPREEVIPRMVAFLERQVEAALKAGVKGERITLDPGIGFGKTPAQNLIVLDRIADLCALGFPVLVGASRKRFIGEITGRDPLDRTAGSLAAHLQAVANGAAAIRAHDIAEHHDAMRVMHAIATRAMPRKDQG